MSIQDFKNQMISCSLRNNLYYVANVESAKEYFFSYIKNYYMSVCATISFNATIPTSLL